MPGAHYGQAATNFPGIRPRSLCKLSIYMATTLLEQGSSPNY